MDPFFQDIKDHVQQLEQDKGQVCSCDHRQYLAAVFIIRAYLGDLWWKGAGPEPNVDGYWKNSGGQFGTFRLQSRVIMLAELLLNLRSIHGMPERVDGLKTTKSLETAVGELEGAALLMRSGIPFQFVKPSNKLGLDFDVTAVIDGMQVAIEMKTKLEETAPTANSVKDTLKTARDQLPKDQPGVVFLQLPEKWANTKEGRLALDDGLKLSFGGTSRRISAVVAHWERWRSLDTAGALRTHMFKYFPSPKARLPLPSLEKAVKSWGPQLSRNWIALERIVCEKSDTSRSVAVGNALTLEAFVFGAGPPPPGFGILHQGKPDILQSPHENDVIAELFFKSTDFSLTEFTFGQIAHITLDEGSIGTFEMQAESPDKYLFIIQVCPSNEGLSEAMMAKAMQLETIDKAAVAGQPPPLVEEVLGADPFIILLRKVMAQLRTQDHIPSEKCRLYDFTISFLRLGESKIEFAARYPGVSFRA